MIEKYKFYKYDDCLKLDIDDLISWLETAAAASCGCGLPTVEETEESYIIKHVAPGRKKEDFKVEVEEKAILTISYKDYFQSWTLPALTISDEDIEASYEAGILIVKIKKPNKKASSFKKMLITVK